MNRSPIRLIVAAAVVCSAAACVDRPRLFDEPRLALDHQYAAFYFGFVTRFVGPGGEDRDAVMLSHLVIGTIEIRLIAARSRDTSTRIIGDK